MNAVPSPDLGDLRVFAKSRAKPDFSAATSRCRYPQRMSASASTYRDYARHAPTAPVHAPRSDTERASASTRGPKKFSTTSISSWKTSHPRRIPGGKLRYFEQLRFRPALRRTRACARRTLSAIGRAARSVRPSRRCRRREFRSGHSHRRRHRAASDRAAAQRRIIACCARRPIISREGAPRQLADLSAHACARDQRARSSIQFVAFDGARRSGVDQGHRTVVDNHGEVRGASRRWPTRHACCVRCEGRCSRCWKARQLQQVLRGRSAAGETCGRIVHRRSSRSQRKCGSPWTFSAKSSRSGTRRTTPPSR